MSPASGQQRAVVHVPATSANLGVGFDVLGLALDLEATFSFELADELSVTGYRDDAAPEDNLVWHSYQAACEALALDARPLSITEDSPIPSSGGLGSSSACIVAGIAAAQALAGRAIDRPFTLDLATQIEGHPDNVAPAVMGGLVSSYIDDGVVRTTRWPVASNLRFVCLAPPYRVLTADARMTLPSMVPMSTVSWQVGRCLAMVSAMASGNAEAIATCCHDRIHEPYRSPLIRDYDLLQDVALEAGAATFLISGSGAAMLAICDNDEKAERVAQATSTALDGLWVRIMRANERGVSAHVERLA